MSGPLIETLTSPWGILLLTLVWAVSGLFVHAAAPGARGGCLGIIVRGFLGALEGVWLTASLQLPNLLTINLGGISFPFMYALMSGIMFMLMFRILRV